MEKYIKALLTDKQIDFPKTHDIERLLALLPARTAVSLESHEKQRLTSYATAARYPGWAEIPVAEARRAVALARRVRGEFRRLLPKEALRRRSV